MRKAVLTGPERIEIRETDQPVPARGEALVRVAAVGLCASDVHLYLGDSVIARFPHTQGHEFSGYLVEYGPDTTGPVPPGSLVSVEPTLPCGECLPCRRGRGNCCVNLRVIGAHVDGALTELISVPAAAVHPTPGVEPEIAAFVEPMAIATHAIARSGLSAGDHAVVFGAGPIGLALIVAGLDRGATMAAIDLQRHRLKVACSIGAELTIRADQPDVIERLRTWADGHGPSIAFEAAGAPAALAAAIDSVAASGTVVEIGISTAAARIPMLDMTQREISLLGSRNSVGEFPLARDIVLRHQQKVRSIISHTYPFDDLDAALKHACKSPEGTGKIVISMASGPGAAARTT